MKTENLSSQGRPLRQRWPLAVAGVLLALAAGVAAGEWLGWPFLASPLQRLLSDKLDRRVLLTAEAGPEADLADSNEAQTQEFSIRFLGGVRVHATQIEIAAPAWSTEPYLVLANGVALKLGYADLWRAWAGQPLRIRHLQAARLDARLERLADGQASWKFRPDTAAAPAALPQFGTLLLTDGVLLYRDAPFKLNLQAHLSLSDDTTAVPGNSVLQATVTGTYRAQALQGKLVSTAALFLAADTARPVAVTLDGTAADIALSFKGSAVNALRLEGLRGHFKLSGPSLAEVGDVVGVTLPSTAAFRSEGEITKNGGTWEAVIAPATVGKSLLDGTFTYERGHSPPMLRGRLGGKRLLLADLGPALGVRPASAPSTTAQSTPDDKVLPDRPFDLPALRAMDANVLVDIREVDLGSAVLEPLRPLQGRLLLTGGALVLKDIDARTAQGRLRGVVRLNGRGSKALWKADLRWDGVQLERLIRLKRAEGAPPFLTGQWEGRTTLQGQGRSTAEILASLDGQLRSELHGGTVSHLVVEAGGLDLAQSLGVLFKGDEPLKVECAVADLAAENGVVHPRLLVLDATDSTIWVDGSLSLATESLDLRAVVSPRDFSLLSLRVPLRVRGSLGNPRTSIEKTALGRKVAASLLLSLINPLASLIPLLDRGDRSDANRQAASCQDLSRRGKATLQATAPRA